MDKLNLNIGGFKCYKENTAFELNNITLLTGANSAGKSSVIQSLLLLKKVSKERIKGQDTLTLVNLNDSDYALELGEYDDIKNRQDNGYDQFFSSESKDISFALQGGTAKIKPAENTDAEMSVNVSSDEQSMALFSRILDNGFVYLNAEREAPHYSYKNTDSNEFCDCHGGNTGSVIGKHENDNCPKIRSFGFSDKNKWKIELDKWLEYIFPGVILKVSGGLDKDIYQIMVHGNAATNVGFGITYALPILVSGLTVPEGGMLIVENPEAHLHAKAQSNMGYFLARMAAAGVRVIIETHSEHIVNGIRRMIVEGKTVMSHEDMTIYFFQNKKGEKGILEISMDNKGNLSAFPEDFFDQVRQDTLSILRIDRAKKAQRNEER